MAIRKFKPQSPDPSINKIKGDTEFARLGHLNRLVDDINNTNIVGPQGAQGVQGPIGPQGVPGPVGPAGLNWQGAWSSGTSYVADDAVGYGGASYFCILATSGTTTPDLDTTHWALLASQGAIGPAGANGAQGPQGAQGIQGPAGGGSYKVYSILAQYNGSNLSVITVLENTLGATITWTPDPFFGVSACIATASSPVFTADKTVGFGTNYFGSSITPFNLRVSRGSDTQVTVFSYRTDSINGLSVANNERFFLEIRVYP